MKKMSDILKEYADYLSEFHPNENFEVIACSDDCGLALTCEIKDGKTYYHISTLYFDKVYGHESLCAYLDKKESEEAYNLLIKYARIRNDKAVKK